jgi:hypothetical protein
VENPASFQFKSPDTESQPKPKPLGVETQLEEFKRDETPKSTQSWLPPEEELDLVNKKFDSLIKEVKQLDGFIRKYQEAATLHQISRDFSEEIARLHDMLRIAQDQNVTIIHENIYRTLGAAKNLWCDIEGKSASSLIDWLNEIDEAIQVMHLKVMRFSNPEHKFIKDLSDARVEIYEKLYCDISNNITHINIEQGGIEQDTCSDQVFMILNAATEIRNDFTAIRGALFGYITKEIEIIEKRAGEIQKELIHRSRGCQ